MINLIIITKSKFKESLNDIALKNGIKNVFFCFTINELEELSSKVVSNVYLISFSNGLIIPKEILRKFKNRAINFHGASPNYPGRDPHHFACFDKVSFYGCTAHYMTAKVDEGEIIASKSFPVINDATPQWLLQKATQEMFVLFNDIIAKIISTDTVIVGNGEKWSGKKTSRKDFLEYCEITPEISEEDLSNRITSFHVNGYTNIYTVINGKKFYYIPDISDY